SITGFLRDTSNQIALLDAGLGQSRYENVLDVRSVGVEGAFSWTSPGEYVELSGNATLQDLRNSSSDGPFGEYGDDRWFHGDRLPNRPWLFANASPSVRFAGLLEPSDELRLTFHTRFTNDYYRGWESLGDRDTKISIPAQTIHSLSLVYALG